MEVPDSITKVANLSKKNRATVYLDISEPEQVGIIKTHVKINSEDKCHKIIEMVSTILKLEAYVFDGDVYSNCSDIMGHFVTSTLKR